jgi:hypothetical protein
MEVADVAFIRIISLNQMHSCPHPGAHPRGAGLPCCSPPNPQNRILKNTDFGDVTMSKVLRDLPLGQNQPVKSANDEYIRFLKNKLIKLKKTRR